MRLNIRMLPPVGLTNRSRTANGRSYSGAPGQVFDVPDMDADRLEGWIAVCPSGTTAERPVANGQAPTVATQPYVITPGFEFLDTTLGKMIIWDGQVWRDPVTGSQV